ncbi:EI24 domain-containing protein [Arcobacter vandammei]|uniref:EI24 domain-containing protein n=1 Tax=Arcobacter vandammei TaxID=2782243 RepID=UPI0018DFEE8C|nr:EI24 domain-containing protein [Arcobacter vandammei]
MGEFDILKRSFEDFFTSSILKLAFIPLIVTLIILYLTFFGVVGFGFETLQNMANTAQNGGEVLIDENAPFYFVWLTYLLVFVFKYSFISTFAITLIYLIGAIFLFHFGIILTLLVIGFLTPNIVNILHKKHYSHLVLKPFGTITNAISNAIKAIFVMLFLYIIFIPLYFVPLINIVAFYLPLYYFFHKLLNFDVASTILSKNEYQEIYKKNPMPFRLRTFALYFISTIPFITLFIAVFYVVYLCHSYFIELEKLYKDMKFIESKSEI